MSEPQLPREVRRRLAIIHHAEEVTGNVAMTCRYFGSAGSSMRASPPSTQAVGRSTGTITLESELRELAASQPLDEWRPPAHVDICPATATSGERRTFGEPGHGLAYLLGSQRWAGQHVGPLRAKAIQQQCEIAAPRFAVVG
jgi:hypothetical protein